MLGAPPVNWSRLLLVTVIFILSAGIQMKMKNAFGWTLDLGLCALLVSAFFLRFWDLVFLILLGLLFLVTSPRLGLEGIMLALLPLGIYAAKKIFSFELWLANLVFVGLSLAIFYGVMGGGITGSWLILLDDFAVSMAFAGILFLVLEYIYRSQFD